MKQYAFQITIATVKNDEVLDRRTTEVIEMIIRSSHRTNGNDQHRNQDHDVRTRSTPRIDFSYIILKISELMMHTLVHNRKEHTRVRVPLTYLS